MGLKNARPETRLKCPVCAAGFRGVEICPRCGTDLGQVMRIAARAWALRQESRAELRTGDLANALRISAAAWRIQNHGVPMMPSLLRCVRNWEEVRIIQKVNHQQVDQATEEAHTVLDSSIPTEGMATESLEPKSGEPDLAVQEQTTGWTISTHLGNVIRRLRSAVLHPLDSRDKQ